MKTKSQISIIDVAKHAGLSPATVSRVLNRSGYFSFETQQKVEAAVIQLGYSPNWMARGLKGMPSRLIGLIIPDITNVFYTSLANSILATLRRSNEEMVLCITDEDPKKDLAYLQILEQKRVDGILYTHPVDGNNSAYVRRLVKNGMPIVEVNRQQEIDLLDAVLADNYRGTKQVMNHLFGLGHRRIAMISGQINISTGSERLSGYQSSFSEAGIDPEPDLLKIGSFTREYGEQAATELLNMQNPPTAIFAASNRIALGLLNTLGQRKIRIPDDISVIAFDDTEWMPVWSPPISAVDIAINEMSQLAVDLLHHRIAQTESNPKPTTYHLGTSLIIRESCKSILPLSAMG
jgi:LacI family transcriptional regulator